MPDVPAIAQVEDALKAALEAWPALSGQNILTDQSDAIAIEEAKWPAVLIYTTFYQLIDENVQGQTRHMAKIEFECLSGAQTVGTISRANHTTVVHIIACLAADRTLGGRLERLEEIDVAPAAANGKDVGSASLQIEVEFLTSRDDWFTLVF